MIATKKTSEYDRAVALLRDLRALAKRRGEEAAFAKRVLGLRAQYPGRPGLQDRFNEAGLPRLAPCQTLEEDQRLNPDPGLARPAARQRRYPAGRVPGVTVAVHDTPENILERITFYDIDSRRIEKHLTGEERILYLKEIKADISYFKRSYERADLQVTITGLDPEASAAAIDARLGRT